jgi:hypothetical protein
VRIFRATGLDAIGHLEDQINAWLKSTLTDDLEGKRTDTDAILLDCTARDERLTTCLGYLDRIDDAMEGNGSMGLWRASR